MSLNPNTINCYNVQFYETVWREANCSGYFFVQDWQRQPRNLKLFVCLSLLAMTNPNQMYSITSIVRTRMARLPRMIRTLFFSPYKILLIAQENKYLGIFFLFYHGIVCCVYSLESPHRGDSNEYTQHTIIV